MAAFDPSGGPARAPLSGARLGRYVLGPRLGVGGAASVYLGLLRGPHDFERVVAVKVVHEHLSESKGFVDMFLDEANLAVRLTHPNIVHSYELGHEGPYLFLVMEYLPGQPLSKVIERARERGVTLPCDVVAWIGARAADGLAHAHALTDDQGRKIGLVHRDVSPQNVFLTYDGRVLVIDWGIARAEGRLTHTGLGKIKGKLAYMAPEQMLRQAVDHRADLFALGATLYEATVGQRPFQAEDEAEAIAMLLEEKAPPPESRVPGFPKALSRVLLRALEREPEDRYPDAADLSRDLESYLRSEGASDPARAMTELLERLFETEREAQAFAVSKLRESAPVRIAELPPGSTTTADPTASTLRPLTRGGGRKWLAAGGVALFLAGAAAVVVARGGDERPPQGPPVEKPALPKPTTVELEIQVEPATEATITVDGVVTSGIPARAAVPRRDRPAPIVVAAKGFETATLNALPDRDQRIVVHLVPHRAEAPPAAAPSAAPKTAPARAGATGSKPGAQSPAPSRKKDSLVTEYPF